MSCTGCAAWTTIVSVALNLFLVGVIVGPLLGPDRDREPFPEQVRIGQPMRPPREPGFVLDRVSKELQTEDAEKLRVIFQEERKGFKKRHNTMHASMQKLAALLKAEKPDMAALHQVMDEIHAFGEGMHQGMNHALERVATEVSFEGRQKIAKAMEKGLFGGGPMPPPPGGHREGYRGLNEEDMPPMPAMNENDGPVSPILGSAPSPQNP
ncbi:MAG: periplasmic heavy metal sensor [Alphaproteobacteria bacterium]|nr:periplasmic heavy metal sensor [Alphaproteobacteria bacterium]